jgi:hypothetical protein
LLRCRQTDLIRKTAVLTHKRYPQSLAERAVSNAINRLDDQARSPQRQRRPGGSSVSVRAFG